MVNVLIAIIIILIILLLIAIGTIIALVRILKDDNRQLRWFRRL